jgi:hypothetical protein
MAKKGRLLNLYLISILSLSMISTGAFLAGYFAALSLLGDKMAPIYQKKLNAPLASSYDNLEM